MKTFSSCACQLHRLFIDMKLCILFIWKLVFVDSLACEVGSRLAYSGKWSIRGRQETIPPSIHIYDVVKSFELKWMSTRKVGLKERETNRESIVLSGFKDYKERRRVYLSGVDYKVYKVVGFLYV